MPTGAAAASQVELAPGATSDDKSTAGRSGSDLRGGGDSSGGGGCGRGGRGDSGKGGGSGDGNASSGGSGSGGGGGSGGVGGGVGVGGPGSSDFGGFDVGAGEGGSGDGDASNRSAAGVIFTGNWDQMTETQRRNWHKRRRKQMNKARTVSLGLSRPAR